MLGEAIGSLQRQSLPAESYEIIVVDNASTDDTRKVVEAAAASGGRAVRYVREEQLGLHNARHCGARAARAEILAFTDDDAVCEPNWLEEILRSYADERVGAVGGKALPRWAVEPPRWILSYPGSLGLLDLGEEPRELPPPRSIYGVNFSIRRSLLFELGGFNPECFGETWLGDGETGLCLKIHAAGWKILYQPKAVVWHIVSKERISLAYMKHRFRNQGASDSYTAYRKRRPGRFRLGLESGLFASLAIFFKLWAQVERCIPGFGYWQNELYSSYCHSRAAYQYRLIVDTELRAIADRERWLEKDS